MLRKAKAHAGTRYPITEQELEVLQNAQLQPGGRGWRPYPEQALQLEEVASNFVKGMKDGSCWHSWTQEEWNKAGYRLWKFLEDKDKGRSRYWNRDIIFKIFNDLDVCFFNMELCRRVHLRWGSRPRCPSMIAETEPPNGHCWRVQITLYYDVVCNGHPPLFYVLGSLMHEMLHAYLLIMTLGNDHEYNMAGQPCYHGPSFVRCARVLNKVYKGRLEMLDGQEEAEGHYPGWNHPGQPWHPGAMFGGTLYPEDFYHPRMM